MRLAGAGGNDNVYGGNGNDLIQGSEGNDVLIGDHADGIIFGDDNVDPIHGGAGRDALQSGDGNGSIYGHGGSEDALWCDNGSETLGGRLHRRHESPCHPGNCHDDLTGATRNQTAACKLNEWQKRTPMEHLRKLDIHIDVCGLESELR